MCSLLFGSLCCLIAPIMHLVFGELTQYHTSHFYPYQILLCRLLGHMKPSDVLWNVWICNMNKYCNICIRRILSHAKTIKCIICLETCHIKCITLNPEEQLDLLAQAPSWYCATCIGNTLPFNHFIDDDEFYQSLFTKDYLMPFMSNSPGDMFSPIDITLDNHESPLDDIDPDLNYYNELHFLNGVNCSYLNEDSLKKMYDSQTLKTRKSSLSLFHMNIRSIPRNINAMSDYIDCLNVDFHVIGISETWLKEDNCGLYDIPGYHCKEKHRPSKVGGGVAIYVKD